MKSYYLATFSLCFEILDINCKTNKCFAVHILNFSKNESYALLRKNDVTISMEIYMLTLIAVEDFQENYNLL